MPTNNCNAKTGCSRNNATLKSRPVLEDKPIERDSQYGMLNESRPETAAAQDEKTPEQTAGDRAERFGHRVAEV